VIAAASRLVSKKNCLPKKSRQPPCKASRFAKKAAPAYACGGIFFDGMLCKTAQNCEAMSLCPQLIKFSDFSSVVKFP
jgi:hypothetical protein